MVHSSIVRFWGCGAVAWATQSCETETSFLLQTSTQRHVSAEHTGPQHSIAKNAKLLEQVKSVAGSLKGMAEIPCDTADGVTAAIDLANSVLDNTLPAIQEEHDRAVEQVNIAKESVDSCATDPEEGQDFVDQLGQSVQQWRDSHGTCRSTEEQMVETQTSTCEDFHTYVTTLPDMSCGYPNRDDTSSVLDTLDTVSAYIEAHRAAAHEKHDNCENAGTGLVAQTAECAVDQRHFEENYCSHLMACHTLSHCRQREETLFHRITSSILDAVEPRKTEFETITQIQCFLDMMALAVNNSHPVGDEEMERCGEDVNTDHLTIVIPELDDLVGCDDALVSMAPCTPAFFDHEYPGWAQRQTIEELCWSCPGLPGARAPGQVGNSGTVGHTWEVSTNVVMDGKSFRKQGTSQAYDAYAILPQAEAISVNAGQLNGHMKIGLTRDPSDDSDYTHGHYVGLFPNGRIFMPPFADDTYTAFDIITLRIVNGRMSIHKNNDLLNTWDGHVEVPSLFAKLWFYEPSVSMNAMGIPSEAPVSAGLPTDPSSAWSMYWRGRDEDGGVISAAALESGEACFSSESCMRQTACGFDGNIFSTETLDCSIESPCEISFKYTGALWQGFSTGFPDRHTWSATCSPYDGMIVEAMVTGVGEWEEVSYTFPSEDARTDVLGAVHLMFETYRGTGLCDETVVENIVWRKADGSREHRYF